MFANKLENDSNESCPQVFALPCLLVEGVQSTQMNGAKGGFPPISASKTWVLVSRLDFQAVANMRARSWSGRQPLTQGLDPMEERRTILRPPNGDTLVSFCDLVKPPGGMDLKFGAPGSPRVSLGV